MPCFAEQGGAGGANALGFTNVYGRQNRLRDVVGDYVILGTAILTRSRNLFGWASVSCIANFSACSFNISSGVNPALDVLMPAALVPMLVGLT